MVFSKKIIIFIGKVGCIACVSFKQEWEKLKKNLGTKYHYIYFEADPSKNIEIHPSLKAYTEFFPTILIADPISYSTIFSDDDTFIDNAPTNYQIKAIKYNVVEDVDGKLVFANKPFLASHIESWVSRAEKLL